MIALIVIMFVDKCANSKTSVSLISLSYLNLVWSAVEYAISILESWAITYCKPSICIFIIIYY